ncbi:MAG TPA: hypothetical protein VKB35_12835 [Ktedonobacteraceae bacterium]|nr:hypothetical protein [Ktedonobacteraceae bacterium]
MSSKDVTDLIIAFQAIITLFISLRAFYLYFKARSDILFIVGLSMAVIVVGGVAGLAGDYLIKSSAFNTFWFRYIGQIVSYLFILFISLPGAERHMRALKRWNLVASTLLLFLLLLTPLLPPIPGATFTEILSGARGVVCLAVFFNYYLVMYTMKGSHFSALMCVAFLLIAIGIAIYTFKFSAPNPLPYDYVGDSIRAAGLLFMLAAFFVG